MSSCAAEADEPLTCAIAVPSWQEEGRIASKTNNEVGVRPSNGKK
jgi:hypothetical protein